MVTRQNDGSWKLTNPSMLTFVFTAIVFFGGLLFNIGLTYSTLDYMKDSMCRIEGKATSNEVVNHEQDIKISQLEQKAEVCIEDMRELKTRVK